MVIILIIALVVIPVILGVITSILMNSKKPVKMSCSHCGHTWEISKRVYMNTPYVQRGTNALFKCVKCGSEGTKSKK